ncbi:MAG: type IV toxin-antitoxin system AbiEi family antitoxin [Candidatus Eisenbacteria bacterium]
MRYGRVLQTALERLRALPPINSVKQVSGAAGRPCRDIDAVVEVGTDQGVLVFELEVKPVLKRPIPQHLSLLRRQACRHFLLVSEYVNASISQSLKEEEINFIDSQGNAYINVPGFIYIDVRAGKPGVQSEKQRTALFQPKGLQLLFILLTDRSAVSQTTRVLRARAGISLERTVSSMKELREKGFIHEIAKREYQLANRKTLLEQWLANYGDHLRPSLVLGAFRSPRSVEPQIPEIMMRLLPNHQGSYAIGGSLGAYLLTRYYRGWTSEIFVLPERTNEVRRELKLIPGRDTNVTLLHLFSPEVVYHTDRMLCSVAHPLLLYAELLYHGGEREREAARVIYEEFLKKEYDEA